MFAMFALQVKLHQRIPQRPAGNFDATINKYQQISTISLNLLTSRRSCCTHGFRFSLLPRSPEILGLRSSLLTLYGAGLGFSWQTLPCIFAAARLCDSFVDGCAAATPVASRYVGNCCHTLRCPFCRLVTI